MRLNYHAPDIHSFTPDAAIIGDVLSHTGNGKQYVITDFVWMGATNEWGYAHRAIGEHGVTIVRPLWHITSKRKNGEARYKEHESYSQYYLRDY